jgi:tripartite-type tricarboxylate transporter receptor subunit TctC
MKARLQTVLRNLLAAVLALAAGGALAQTWPAKPVKLIVGFAPGGGTDLVGRAIATKLADALGQPFVVENKPGASGTLSAELVAKSPADGYTLLVTAAGILTIAPNFSKVAFDTFKDFEHVALVVTSPFVVVTNPSLPARTLAEFNALAKAKPGSINFGSSGNGGAPHLSGELYKRMAGVDLVHVPYKGLAPALADLLGGQIQASFADVNLVLKHVEAGKLRALAVTGGKRFSVMPDVPTVAEAGVPGYRAETWYGLSAPAGTPPAIVARLYAEVRKAVDSPELQKQFVTQGLAPSGLTSAEYAALVREDFNKWSRLISDANIRPN